MKAKYSKYDNEALFINSPISEEEKANMIGTDSFPGASKRMPGESDRDYCNRVNAEFFAKFSE